MQHIQRLVPRTSVYKSLVMHWLLVSVMGVALIVHLWGIQRNLPFMSEADEPHYVRPAVRMAATGDLNPHWFGLPGSTVIYSLAALFDVWHVLTRGGTLLRADPGVQAAFDADPSSFFFLGRLLSISFAVLSVPLIYLLGRRAFDTRVGLIGAWFFALFPGAIVYAQVVRTDSAAAFFGVLALWLCLRVYDRPTIRNQVLAGGAIGLSIATRYFMVALVPVLLAVDVLLIWQHGVRWRVLKPVLLGGLAIGGSFALATPYFFLDFATVLKDVRHEARSSHLGGDGLSRWGNFWWHLTHAIPESISWPLTILAGVGGAVVMYKRWPPQLLLLGFALVFLIGISLPSLHMRRWVIQMLPVVALLAAVAIVEGTAYVRHWLQLSMTSQRFLIVSLVLLCSVLPLHQLGMAELGQSRPSTGIQAREWILQYIPPGSYIAQELYTAPLTPPVGTHYTLLRRNSLAHKRTIDDYVHGGYRYLVVSSWMFERYLAEPERYPSEVAFYQALFAEGHLLQEFRPANTLREPMIRIYEIPSLPTSLGP